MTAVDTASKERGIDISATRGGDRLIVEVKGYPTKRHLHGPKAGQKKKAHPSGQATTYLASAVLTAIAHKEGHPDWRVTIGLPDTPRYRQLLSRCGSTLEAVGIDVVLVSESGDLEWSSLPW